MFKTYHRLLICLPPSPYYFRNPIEMSVRSICRHWKAFDVISGYNMKEIRTPIYILLP